MATQDLNRYYNNFNPSEVGPGDLAYEIGEVVNNECDNLKNSKGTSGNDNSNCSVLSEELIDAIRQELKAIKAGDIVIAANEESKCDGTNLPTVASILSRVLRFSEAVACTLCTYDPVLIKILKQGEYPQILMGQAGSIYPRWANPSEYPSENSKLPLTSGGAYQAIQDALLSVFHEATQDPAWVNAGGELTYQFYAENLTDLNGQPALCEQQRESHAPCQPTEGDKALLKTGANGTNQVYVYESGSWVALDVLGDTKNYAVVQITKGMYGGNEIYWLNVNGVKTWNQMDVSDQTLKKRLTKLEEIYDRAVLNATTSEEYLLTVKNTKAQADAVSSTAGKTTIALVIGSV